MAGNIKINPDLAQGVSNVFNTKSGELTGIITALNNEVANNIGNGKPAWEGQQAAEFETAWQSEFKPALEKLVQALDGARDLLNKTIAAYQELDS